MPAPKKPNTTNATAAVIRKGNETMARKLRAAGYVVVPPEQAASVPPEIFGLYGPTDTMVTVAELAAAVGMSDAPETIAAYAGAFIEPDSRTGRLPKRWYGQGMEATFTRAEADQIEADWRRDSEAAQAGQIYPIVEPDAGLDLAAANRRHEAAVAEVAERYRP